MLRKRAALLAALLVGTGLAGLVPSSPASATTPAACIGTGNAGVSPGLFYPVGAPQVTTTGTQTTVLFHNTHKVASWTFGITGACTVGTGFGGSGVLQGYCGHSTGVGTSDTGHLIQWVSLGSFLILTNGVIAVANATPNLLAGQSCAQTALNSAGASQFILVGAGTATNCLDDSTDLLTLPMSKGLTSQFAPLTFSILDPIANLWHVTFSIPHIHWGIHGCVPVFLK